jgi:hypothetical protein
MSKAVCKQIPVNKYLKFTKARLSHRKNHNTTVSCFGEGGVSGSFDVALAGLELVILLPQPPKCRVLPRKCIKSQVPLTLCHLHLAPGC